MGTDLHELLRTLKVWDPETTELPSFDPATAPEEPLTLFTQWFARAVAAGQSEPHTMSLATADPDGTPDVRIVMLHGADAQGWAFATHAGSRKGRQLAARPYAALGFYWPVQGRQVRVRGPVSAAPAAEGRADLHARSTGALAAALTGRQSEVLGSAQELARASQEAWERAQRQPDARPCRPGRSTASVRRRWSSSRGTNGAGMYAWSTADRSRGGRGNCCGPERGAAPAPRDP